MDLAAMEEASASSLGVDQRCWVREKEVDGRKEVIFLGLIIQKNRKSSIHFFSIAMKYDWGWGRCQQHI